VYVTASSGYTVTIPALVGRTIKGRLYRDGVTYRPTQSEDNVPSDKEYYFETGLGKLTFSIPFEDTDLDIPYE
jgi:hypothetical protein